MAFDSNDAALQFHHLDKFNWVGHGARVDALLCASVKCEFMGVL